MDFFEVIFGNGRWIYFWHGFEVTMVLTTISVLTGLLLGLIISLMRTSIARPFKFIKSFKGYNKSKILQTIYNFNPLKTFAKFYISIIRGTPTLVQLLIMYYVVFGSMRTMPKLIIAAIAFAMNSAAYIAEIIRGGIESVDKGQLEAARSLGFSHTKAMIYVVMPQALKNSMPGLIGEGVTMFKETSIVGYISVMDVTMNSKSLQAAYYSIKPILFTGVVYYVSVKLFSFIGKRLEMKLKEND